MAGMRTDQEIADVLSLSRRTVSGHVTHILPSSRCPPGGQRSLRGRELGLLTDAAR